MSRGLLIIAALALGLFVYGLIAVEAERGWHTYVNEEYGFSLRYPDSFSPMPDTALPMAAMEDAIAGFRLVDGRYYDGTNLDEAAVIVAARKGVPSLSRCLQLGMAGLPSGRSWHRRMMGATVFYRRVLHDAGAGNLYKLIDYRTLHGGTCYTLTLFIHWGNIGAFTPGAVSPFDEGAVLRELERVLQAFRFLRQPTARLQTPPERVD